MGLVPTEEDLKRLGIEATMRESLNLRVLVVGGGFQYIKMFFDAGFKGATTVKEADIVCFTGGEDVDPKMYGEDPLPETYYNPRRDALEAGVYGECLGLNKPMVGICRGAQFLNVMQKGGKLWQDVNHHALFDGHEVTLVKTGEVIPDMTSTHHQQMIAGENAEIIAVAALSTKKKGHGRLVDRLKPELDDMEVLWYPDTSTLCFQPHPEIRHGKCRDFFLDLMDEYVIPLTSGYRS